MLSMWAASPAFGATGDLWGVQRLFAYGGAAGDFCGSAVAVHGDLAAVGVVGADIGAVTNAGKVFLFERQGPNWQSVGVLQAPAPKAGGMFGYSLAMSDDVLVVGAPYEDSGYGAAYVFVRSGGSWVYGTRLGSPVGSAIHFGASVATNGGIVAVAAPDWGSSAGIVYVYEKPASTWTLKQALTDPSPLASARFGESLAMLPDSIVVGAPDRQYDTVPLCGVVFAFKWSSATSRYELAQTIAPPAPESNLGFGRSIAADRKNLLVGSPGKTVGGAVFHGGVDWYASSGTSWVRQSTLMPLASLGAGAQYGSQVAVSGSTAVASAPQWNAGRGIVEVFDLTLIDEPMLREAVALSGPSEMPDGASFGSALGLSGGNLLCGAPNDERPYTFQGSVTGYTFLHYLAPADTAKRVAGTDRYATSAAASRRGFPCGAPAVVVCTGENWPDALGGAGLAGAVHGPVLLTRASALPTDIEAEIKRLGAVKAYVLGGTGAVSDAVKNRLITLLGSANVVRIAGTDRYATARAVAAKTIELRGSGYAGLAFVATGAKYPDAVAASPLLSYIGTPLLLANPASTSVDLPPQVTYAVVVGGEGAVSPAQFNDLVAKLGASNVVRKYGPDRYATAAALAQMGVDGGMNKSGVGLATGENFPDALSAGPMLGAYGCPLLLTRSTLLSQPVDETLRAWRPDVSYIHVIGGTGAITDAVKNAAAAAAWGP